jgi:hypothetical protein
LLLGAAGCRHTDLVEAELRTRERELREVTAQLHVTEGQNEALEREVSGLRQGSSAKIPPELAAQVYTVRAIALGRLTGGTDDDGRGGDKALQVVLEPRDPDGQIIKAPGTLYIEALQISEEGLKVPLSSWEVPPGELRATWRSSLFGVGYFVILPWKVPPSTEKLRVVARLTLADGRLFEADRDIRVRLPAVPAAPAPVLEPVHPFPEASPPLLPVPRAAPKPAGPADGTEADSVAPAAAWRRARAPGLVGAVRVLPPTRIAP